MGNSNNPNSNSSSEILEKGERHVSFAEAKEDFLDLIDKYVRKAEREYGKSKAIDRALAAFNNGNIGQDIKTRLRKPLVSRSCYYNWLACAEGKTREGKGALRPLLITSRVGRVALTLR